MARLNRFAATTAVAAVLCLAAAPAMAHDDYHGHHWHHHDDIDGGDVLAGAALVGVIAAIASIAKSHSHAGAPQAQPAVPDDRQGYGDGAAEDGGDEAQDRAADACAQGVEGAHRQVGDITDVAPQNGGWAVSGVLADGSSFACRLDGNGQVLSLSYGAPAAPAPAPYSGARPPVAAPGDENEQAPGVDNRPVWHDPAPSAVAPAPDDGRHNTSQAPDFGNAA